MVGHHGQHGQIAVRRVRVEPSGDSAPVRLRSRQVLATTAPGPVTSLGRVTTTRARVSGRAGRNRAPAR